ncbi:MAG: hypothetical protein EOS11_19710 [Mesorhizobium sp.]|nr:MAG: hypothetical protein EOS11_19710 [Mesorhizobium sp.]
MSNQLDGLSETVKWRLLVEAAKKGAESQGYALTRVPGRGLSNIWSITKNGKTQTASIRTTRDRWFAFPPLRGGTKWKTLDDVEVVIVATVDSKDDPENVEVYIFPADEVRARFNAAYAARIKSGQKTKDNFGMWVALDHDDRRTATSVGSGIVEKYKQVAKYPITDLLKARPDHEVLDGRDDADEEETRGGIEVEQTRFSTIAEVMAWARTAVAEIAGVRDEAVKLDLKIEY